MGEHEEIPLMEFDDSASRETGDIEIPQLEFDTPDAPNLERELQQAQFREHFDDIVMPWLADLKSSFPDLVDELDTDSPEIRNLRSVETVEEYLRALSEIAQSVCRLEDRGLIPPYGETRPDQVTRHTLIQMINTIFWKRFPTGQDRQWHIHMVGSEVSGYKPVVRTVESYTIGRYFEEHWGEITELAQQIGMPIDDVRDYQFTLYTFEDIDIRVNGQAPSQREVLLNLAKEDVAFEEIYSMLSLAKWPRDPSQFPRLWSAIDSLWQPDSQPVIRESASSLMSGILGEVWEIREITDSEVRRERYGRLTKSLQSLPPHIKNSLVFFINAKLAEGEFDMSGWFDEKVAMLQVVFVLSSVKDIEGNDPFIDGVWWEQCIQLTRNLTGGKDDIPTLMQSLSAESIDPDLLIKEALIDVYMLKRCIPNWEQMKHELVKGQKYKWKKAPPQYMLVADVFDAILTDYSRAYQVYQESHWGKQWSRYSSEFGDFWHGQCDHYITQLRNALDGDIDVT